MATTIEIAAYAAGLFDGEGYLGLSRVVKPAYSQYQMLARINMVASAGVTLLQKEFGGTLHVRELVDPNCRAQTYWSIQSRSGVYDFLSVIRPYSLVKKNHVELAFLYFETIPTDRIDPELRDAFYLKFRELNKRGKDV